YRRAVLSYGAARRPGSKLAVAYPQTGPSSLLCDNFNQFWALARNNYEAGCIDGFAMIHADVEAEGGWLDILHEEMLAVGADLISARIRIKDGRGFTSTALDLEDPWRPRRLTQKEFARLPATFTDADALQFFG